MTPGYRLTYLEGRKLLESVDGLGSRWVTTHPHPRWEHHYGGNIPILLFIISLHSFACGCDSGERCCEKKGTFLRRCRRVLCGNFRFSMLGQGRVWGGFGGWIFSNLPLAVQCRYVLLRDDDFIYQDLPETCPSPQESPAMTTTGVNSYDSHNTLPG